jgi:hypothetical protein
MNMEITDFEICRRLAILPNLCVDHSDPHNARYLVPLPNADDEEAAHDMADCMFGAPYNDGSGVKYSERSYYECLVDARRMYLDKDYAKLFDGPWLTEAKKILGLPSEH